MKASELIVHLQQAIAEHGDHDILLYDDMEGFRVPLVELDSGSWEVEGQRECTVFTL